MPSILDKMARKDESAFCCGCGGPFSRGEHPPEYMGNMPQWHLDVAIVRCVGTGEWPSEDIPVCEDIEILEHLVCTGGPYFRRSGSPRMTWDYTSFYSSGDVITPGYPGNWPFHWKCLEIAKRVVSYNQNLPPRLILSPSVGPTSIREMIEILYARLCDSEESFGGWTVLVSIPEPNSYYGYGGTYHEAIQPEWLSREKNEIIEQPPFPLVNLTGFILSKLTKFHYKQSAQELYLRKNLMTIPLELMEQCLDLRSVGVLSLGCSRVLPPRFWRDALLRDNLLPWLWDLDLSEVPQNMLEEKDASDSDVWDWELLVRQLTQPEPFKDHPNGYRATCYGLCNRRRVWLIIESMRFGDIFDADAATKRYCGSSVWEREATPWEIKHYPHLWPHEAEMQKLEMASAE